MIEKPFNLKIVETKKEILEVLNKAEIPITVSQMIINEVKNIIDLNAKSILQNEEIEYVEKLNENKDSQNSKGGDK